MNKNSELLLFSLFEIPSGRTPKVLMDQHHEMFKSERVLTIDEKGLMDILNGRVSDGIDVQIQNRCNIEAMGEERYQIIVAACVHTDEHFLALQLTRDPNFVDGYHSGCITYPQGHVSAMDCGNSRVVASAIRNDEEEIRLTEMEFLNILKQSMFREFMEELKVSGAILPPMRDYIVTCIEDCIQNVPAIYPIHINKSVSTRRHLCLLFDINLTDEAMTTIFPTGVFETNEPSKHRAMVVSYDDLLKLNSTDDICSWMADSFRLLPFMRNSFIEPYIQKMNET